jgi:uncharacterized protein (TIGR03435 family)
MRLRTLALLLAAASVGSAQQKPAFEVASVKPNLEGSGDFSFDFAADGRVTARNFTVWNLIRSSYNLRELQMSGGPAWIKTRGFDIQALPAKPVPRPEVLKMLQTLLEDRFQLKYHRETREGPAYALTVANVRPKLPPAHEGPQQPKFGDLDQPSMTLDSLRQILEFDLDRPVFDRTGLSGPFAIRLQWYSQRAANPDPSQPALSTALQEQLGLKLESIKAPLDYFIIDSVEAPSEN